MAALSPAWREFVRRLFAEYQHVAGSDRAERRLHDQKRLEAVPLIRQLAERFQAGELTPEEFRHASHQISYQQPLFGFAGFRDRCS